MHAGALARHAGHLQICTEEMRPLTHQPQAVARIRPVAPDLKALAIVFDK